MTERAGSLSSRPKTLIDKIWDAHVIVDREDGQSLLWVDRHLLHEGSFHAFDQLAKRQARLHRPDLTFGIADHYVPTRNRNAMQPEIKRMVDQLTDNCARHDVTLFGLDDPRQGIVHVTIPAQGLTLPGNIMVCGDSHTSTHGAFGAYAFGIGASEVAHVMMTQTIWQKRPKAMRVTVEGALPEGTGAKDIALHLIASIGADGAQGHAIEYAGSTIRALSMEGRLTLCNLSIEAGARLGLIAPDDTTFACLRGKPFAPKGDAFEAAVQAWHSLRSDPQAEFDREVTIDASALAPTLTWGTTPEQALPISASTPDPATIQDAARARTIRDALDYMGLKPNQRLDSIAIDRYLVRQPSRTVLLSVRGDSMQDAGLLEGDNLVVDRGAPARVGDIVVAIVDNQFTVKYLAQDARGFYLKPGNMAYAPIRPQGQLEIYGVVTGSFRRY